MKKLFAIIAAMLLTVSVFAQNGKSIYNKYSDEEGVSAVYISPSMFKLIGKLPDLDLKSANGVNFSSVIQALDGFYLIDSESKAINSEISKDVNKFIQSGHYDLLMEAKDNGEKMNVYIVGKGDILTSVVMVATSGDECTFICIDGKISRKDFEKLLAESQK